METEAVKTINPDGCSLLTPKCICILFLIVFIIGFIFVFIIKYSSNFFLSLTNLLEKPPVIEKKKITDLISEKKNQINDDKDLVPENPIHLDDNFFEEVNAINVITNKIDVAIQKAIDDNNRRIYELMNGFKEENSENIKNIVLSLKSLQDKTQENKNPQEKNDEVKKQE